MLKLLYWGNTAGIRRRRFRYFFANDTICIIKSKIVEDKQANVKMPLLKTYLDADGIQVNEVKIQYMIVSLNTITHQWSLDITYDMTLHILRKLINEVKCLKLFGVHIDNKLSFTPHYKNWICQRLM